MQSARGCGAAAAHACTQTASAAHVCGDASLDVAPSRGAAACCNDVSGDLEQPPMLVVRQRHTLGLETLCLNIALNIRPPTDIGHRRKLKAGVDDWGEAGVAC
jgi:hypothetical protein